MSIDEEFPTKKRIGKKDPIKYRNRIFHKGATLEEIRSIERSTSPHQTQILKDNIEIVKEQINVSVEKIEILRERIANLKQILNQYPKSAVDNVGQLDDLAIPVLEETAISLETEPMSMSKYPSCSGLPFECGILEPIDISTIF